MEIMAQCCTYTFEPVQRTKSIHCIGARLEDIKRQVISTYTAFISLIKTALIITDLARKTREISTLLYRNIIFLYDTLLSRRKI